jgi:hypothetical protein
MTLKKDYSSMSKADLQLALKNLRENLVDLEETVQFNLTYSAAHISGQQVRKDEESLRLLKEEIDRVERLMSEMSDRRSG